MRLSCADSLMLSGVSGSGRRCMQALHRLACSGLDAMANSNSSSSRLPGGACARAEQPCWSCSAGAAPAAPFSSRAVMRRQESGQQAAAAHTDSLAFSRGVLPHQQLPRQTSASVCWLAAMAGGARGAKSQAGQQKGGTKQQQQLRQRRAAAIEYPVENQRGVVSVLSTKNNTIVTLADEAGNVKAWCAQSCLWHMYASGPEKHMKEALVE